RIDSAVMTAAPAAQRSLGDSANAPTRRAIAKPPNINPNHVHSHDRMRYPRLNDAAASTARIATRPARAATSFAPSSTPLLVRRNASLDGAAGVIAHTPPPTAPVPIPRRAIVAPASMVGANTVKTRNATAASVSAVPSAPSALRRPTVGSTN